MNNLTEQLRPLFESITKQLMDEVVPLVHGMVRDQILATLGGLVPTPAPAASPAVEFPIGQGPIARHNISGSARRQDQLTSVLPPRPIAPSPVLVPIATATPASPQVLPDTPRSQYKRVPDDQRQRALITCRACGEIGHNSSNKRCRVREPGTVATTAASPPTSDDEEESGARPVRLLVRQRARTKAADYQEPVVIGHAALVAKLAADRGNSAGGDAGGFVARQDGTPSIVGHVDVSVSRREVCPVHNWVGRFVFNRDRHDLCVAPVELEAVAPDAEAVA